MYFLPIAYLQRFLFVARSTLKAEEQHAAMLLRAGDDARRRQCLSRTRGECVAALANFLPALRKRLFLVVDVTGPVSQRREKRHSCHTVLCRTIEVIPTSGVSLTRENNVSVENGKELGNQKRVVVPIFSTKRD